MDWLVTQMRSDWIAWTVAGFLAVVGTGLGIVALVEGARASRRAEGRVVAVDESTDSEGETWHQSVVVFSAGGYEHRVKDRVQGQRPRHRIGDPVAVYFPPGRPADAQVGRSRLVRLFVVVAAVGWSVLILMAVW
jgi:hypothetical protein